MVINKLKPVGRGDAAYDLVLLSVPQSWGHGALSGSLLVQTLKLPFLENRKHAEALFH